MNSSRCVSFQRRIIAAAVSVVVMAACGTTESTVVGDDGELNGTLTIEPAVCESAAPVRGSWFRMIQPGGTTADGPFITNFDSLCDDQTFTVLTPGTDGGLRVGAYQPHPTLPFDAASNGLAASIMSPARFYSVNFAIGTVPRDPLTGTVTPAPEVRAIRPATDPDSTTWLLDGKLAALIAAWNNEFFHQGAPQPDGGLHGATSRPKGTIDIRTGRYRLQWTSEVEFGLFRGFVGMWNLEGVFVPRE